MTYFLRELFLNELNMINICNMKKAALILCFLTACQPIKEYFIPRGLVWWHIKFCRLFNVKSSLYKHQIYMAWFDFMTDQPL